MKKRLAEGRASANPVASPGRKPHSRPIKVFVELHGVHVLRVSLGPVESVEELHDAVAVACAETGEAGLEEVDLQLDDNLVLQYLDDSGVAHVVDYDTPIGLLKCAKAMRVFRK